MLAHDRRRIVHFNVTAHPTAEWTAQQLREAFPFDQIPQYLLRDRDGIFGSEFRINVAAMGIKEVLSTPRSPWERAFVERVIGTIRQRMPGSRDCLQPSVFVPACEVFCGVLSRVPDAPLAVQGRAGTETCATAERRSHYRDTASWWASSPVRTARRLNAVAASAHFLPPTNPGSVDPRKGGSAARRRERALQVAAEGMRQVDFLRVAGRPKCHKWDLR